MGNGTIGARPRRRDILRTGSVTLVGASTVGCDLLATEPSGSDERDNNRSSSYDDLEAPILAREVKGGNLPPLEARVPKTPLVVEPIDSLGVYGGQWKTALLGPADTAWLVRTIGYENLTRWEPDFSAYIPNIAGSIDTEEGGLEYVFHLREGMKWSDGADFTADDLVFACEEVLKNPDLNPDVPILLVSGGEPGTATKLDQYTVSVTFTVPHGLFLELLATPQGSVLTATPKHYLTEFHPDHNSDLDALVESEGFPSWSELFLAKSDLWANPELPRVYPWVPEQALGESDRVVAKRNPYYWKVDTEGRQLPYLDEVVFSVMSDGEVMLTQALAGDFDMHVRHFTNNRNKPVLAADREAGGYDFFDAAPAYTNTVLIGFNLNHKDAGLREIFQNKDFRIGMSHAIERKPIIDAVYRQQGESWQTAPRPDDPFTNDQLATQYTDYDVDLANEHLDRAGLTARGDDGYRLRFDGSALTFTVITQQDEVPGIEGQVEALELIRDNWRAVGVNANIRVADRSLYGAQTEAGDHDAATITSDGGKWADVYLVPDCFFPRASWSTVYAYAWMAWYLSGGRDGEEPPEATRRQMELYDQLKASIDADERADLMDQILRIAADEFYLIGINLYPMGYGIVKNSFHNVPPTMPLSYQYPTPGPTNPEQYFISGGD